MNNRPSLIFLGFVFCSAVMMFHPHPVTAQEAAVVPGIVEVEENHLYMVPIGSEDGIKKGDTVEIIRDDQKIAEGRLISVLPDNSMLEIAVMFARTDILESDSVRFIKREEKKPGVRKTLGGEGRTLEEERPVDKVTEPEEKRKGLLGSEMHRYEEMAAVEGPLKQEIEQLKAGLVSVKGEYEDKVDTILSSVGGQKDVLAVEKKWEEKLASTEKRYRAQYNERKRLMEQKATRLEAEVAKLNNQLKVVNEGTDKRIQQLLSDLQDKDEEITVLKKDFVEEHLTGEKQWKVKLENLEARYQNELRTQKEDYEKQLADQKKNLEGEISYLNEQVDLVKESSGSKNDELQVRLKDREDLIDSLRKEQFSLESDLKREQGQVRKLESDVATLKDVIAAAKRVHAKELDVVKKPLEDRIADMSVEFIETKHDYERELNAARQAAKDDLMKNESGWVEKLADVEQKYQNELTQMKTQDAAQVNQLRAKLDGQNNVIDLLKQTQAELTSKLKVSEEQYAQLQSERNALGNQLSLEKATRQENINDAKRPLEEKVAELSAQIASLNQEHEKTLVAQGKGYEEEIGKLKKKRDEDASLIEFLNTSMADLTDEADAREKQVAGLQENLKLALGENEAMKKSHLERLKLAKEPLEAEIKSLNEAMAAQKADYEDKIKSVQESTSQYLLKSEEEWQAKLAAKDKERGQELAAAQKDMEQQIKAMEEKMAALTQDHQKELAAAEESSKKELSDLQQQWQTKSKEAELAHQKAFNEELGKKQSVIDFQKEEKSGLVDQMAAMRKDYEAKLRELEVVAKQGQAEVNQQWQAKLAEMQKTHKEELAAATTALKKGYETQIAQIQKTAKQDLKTSEEAWQAKLAQTTQKFQKQLDELANNNSVLEKDKAGLTEQMAALKKDYEQKLENLADDSKKNRAAANEQWQMRINEKEKVIGLLEDDKARLSTEIASLKKDHDAQLKELSEEAKKGRAESDAQWQAKMDSQKQALEKKITSLDEQLSLLKKDSGSIISDLQDQLKKKQDQINSVTKENSGLTSNLSKAERQLTQAEQNIEVLKDQISETQASRSKWIESVKKPMEQEIRGLNDEIVSLKKDYQQKLDDERKRAEQKTADLNAQFDLFRKNSGNTIEELRAQLEERRGLVASLEKKASDLASQLEEQGVQLKASEDNAGQLRKEIKKVKASYDDQMRIAKQPLEEEIKTLTARVKILKEKPQAEWEEKLNAAEENYQKQLKEREENLQSQIAKLNEQLNVLKADSSSVIDQLQADMKTKDSSISVLQSENARIKGNLDSANLEMTKLSDELGQAEEELKSMQKTRTQAVKKVRKPLEERIKTLEAELASVKKDYDRKVNVEGPREVAALKDEINELKGENEQQVALLKKELENERRISADLSKEKAALQLKLSDSSSQTERAGLATKTLEAEVKKLNSQLAFLKDDSEKKIDLLKRKAEDDLSAAEEQWQAKMSASEAQWKTKWAVREAEFQQKKTDELNALEERLFSGKKEVQETIVNLNNRLKMLKDGSDSQIRELETELAAQQYQLSVKEAEYQKRLIDLDQQWTAKMEAAEKEHREELAKQKRSNAEDFLGEKKELRESVIDLTHQFNELRDNSSARIKELEDEVEKKDYKLSLLENRSQQDLLGSDEKWQAKLAAMEEKRQRELTEQKQELEKRFFADKQKLQESVADLNRQLTAQREQAKVDLALKDEEKAAEVALLERKYQDHLANLKEGSNDQVEELATKTKKQDDLITSLQSEKSNLQFDLDQRELELARLRSQVDDLKSDMKKAELSRAEKTRLSQQSLDAQVNELSSQLKIAEAKAAQEKEALEEKWKAKLERAEKDYLQKVKLQRQDLESEVAALTDKLAMVKDDRGKDINEMQTELEDNQTLIRLLSKEKYELAAGLEEKSRAIIKLNEEIIGLKEKLETYKDMLPVASSGAKSKTGGLSQMALASKDEAWYDTAKADTATEQYYEVVRNAILNKFREFDFSKYEGKAGVVKIDFELLANGSPKGDPRFFGTGDQGLKDLLTKCFEDALPFPPFPKDFGKESQRFSLGISFEKK